MEDENRGRQSIHYFPNFQGAKKKKFGFWSIVGGERTFNKLKKNRLEGGKALSFPIPSFKSKTIKKNFFLQNLNCYLIIYEVLLKKMPFTILGNIFKNKSFAN